MVSYCTSEQMDLLRQVFAEVDRLAAKIGVPNRLDRANSG
jgi:hypothetical protein